MLNQPGTSLVWTDLKAALPSLDALLDRTPLTVPPDTCVNDAILALHASQAAPVTCGPPCELGFPGIELCPPLRRKTGILVVEATHPIGILTERDIVRLSTTGMNFSQVAIAEVMTQPLITLTDSPTLTLDDALILFYRHPIRHLPLVNDQGALLGLLTREQAERHQFNTALKISQQQLQLALQQSEAKFRHFADNSHAVIWIAHPTRLDNFYISPAYETVWGRSRQSLQDNPHAWIEAIHPQDRDRVQRKLEQQRQGKHSDIEYRIVRPDGSIRWIWDWGFPIHNEAGQLESFGGIAEDITERKQAEIQLREMSNALNNAVEGISRLDPQGCYVAVNEAYAHTVGYKPLEMVGLSWQQTVHPDDLTEVQAAYQRMLSQGTVELEVRGIRKDGSELIKHLLMVSAYDEQHRFTGHYCFMKDITERKQTEMALRQSEERYRSVVVAMQEGIVLQDQSGTILECNASAERILGLSRDQIMGRSSLDPRWRTIYEDGTPFPGEAHPAMVTLRTGHPCSNVTMGVHKPDGALTWISINSQPLRSPDAPMPYAVVTSFTDITEKKLLEAQFLRAQRLESIGTLASGIAHDLNNILTPILAVAQLLPRKFPELDESTQRLLEILQINAKRGGELVKQVLSFAKGSDGQRVPLQVGHLLIEVGKISQQTFPKSIRIETHVSTQQLALVQADATQLHQVIMNLCVNARDAMPDGGTLSITAENCEIEEEFARLHLDAQVGSHVKITIADTGTGIAADVLDRIFDPFFTTKAQGKGTGLGLSTVLTIVKNHGGFLEVETKIGQGTRFKVYLPARGDSLQKS